VIVVALAGCTESDADQLADLKAQTRQSCWNYFNCENGGQSLADALPETPVAQGVTCMNDAVASGASVIASWGYDEFNPWERNETFVFAIDHEVRVFVSVAHGPDPAEVRELHGCTAPFAVGAITLCTANDPNNPGLDEAVHAMAWSGCSEY
jgi:hypothetical protein